MRWPSMNSFKNFLYKKMQTIITETKDEVDGSYYTLIKKFNRLKDIYISQHNDPSEVKETLENWENLLLTRRFSELPPALIQILYSSVDLLMSNSQYSFGNLKKLIDNQIEIFNKSVKMYKGHTGQNKFRLKSIDSFTEYNNLLIDFSIEKRIKDENDFNFQYYIEGKEFVLIYDKTFNRKFLLVIKPPLPGIAYFEKDKKIIYDQDFNIIRSEIDLIDKNDDEEKQESMHNVYDYMNHIKWQKNLNGQISIKIEAYTRLNQKIYFEQLNFNNGLLDGKIKISSHENQNLNGVFEYHNNIREGKTIIDFPNTKKVHKYYTQKLVNPEKYTPDFYNDRDNYYIIGDYIVYARSGEDEKYENYKLEDRHIENLYFNTTRTEY